MRAGEASSASATFDGTLVITAPSGKQMEVRTTFDTGSDTDAVSVRMATKLIELGCSWGDAGGGIVMADGRETTCVRDGSIYLVHRQKGAVNFHPSISSSRRMGKVQTFIPSGRRVARLHLGSNS